MKEFFINWKPDSSGTELFGT